MDEFLIIKQKLEIYVDGVLIQVERVKEDTDLLNNSSNAIKFIFGTDMSIFVPRRIDNEVAAFPAPILETSFKASN